MQTCVDISNSSDEETSGKEDSQQRRLVYTHKHGEVELHPDNLACLNNKPEVFDCQEKYLKDTIVTFYSAYLLNERVKEKTAKRIHIFDSIFYGHLAKTFPEKPDDAIDEAKWNQAIRWYDYINMFDKDFLIFPICSGEHWFAIVVCYPAHARNIGEDLDDKHNSSSDTEIGSPSDIMEVDETLKPIPGVIVMDSLRIKQKTSSLVVREFLDFAWRDEMKPVKSFSHHGMKDYLPALPKQTNAYDCGIYMLMYLRAFVEQPDEFYRLAREEDRESQSELRTMVNKCMGDQPREDLLKLVQELCKEKLLPTSKRSSTATFRNKS